MASRVTKIYVGNVPESCKNDELRSLFDKYGRVEECDIVKNFGFVHMASDDEAKLAIEALNGTEFMGVKISVEASHSKVRPKPGMGGKGQCYRCGKSGHWSKECPRNNYDRGRGPAPMGPPMLYPHERYSRYGPPRHPLERGYDRHPLDRGYDRPPYGRPYPDPYERRPYPDPYERRPPPPPPDYYRGPIPPPPLPPYDDYPYERRFRDRYDHSFHEDRPYSSSGHAARREAIY